MESLDRRDFVDALLLALIAGCVDAVGFLQLGGFFVSFMSGNSTRLGLGIGSHFWQEAGLAAGLIAIFVGGVALGCIAGRRLGWRRKPGLLLGQGLLLGLAGTFHHLGHPAAATLPMVLAMGMANAIFENGGDVRFGVTYMTGSLVRVGQRIAAVLDGGSRNAWRPYAALWMSLVVGAALGAAAWARNGGQILWLPAALLVLMAFNAWRAAAPSSLRPR